MTSTEDNDNWTVRWLDDMGLSNQEKLILLDCLLFSSKENEKAKRILRDRIAEEHLLGI